MHIAGADSALYEHFEQVHHDVLRASGLPAELWRPLQEKLASERFDAGDFFQLEDVSEGGVEQTGLPLGRRRFRTVLSAARLDRIADVFLVDHAWSFRLVEARSQLRSTPGLADRMAALMNVAEPPEAEEATGTEVALGGSDTDSEEQRTALAAAVREVREVAPDVSATRHWLEMDELPLTDEQLDELNLPSNRPACPVSGPCGSTAPRSAPPPPLPRAAARAAASPP